MLEPYRRHSDTCPYKEKGQNFSKCSCPIYVYGVLKGRHIRQSLRTRDWQRACRKIDRMQSTGDDSHASMPVTTAVTRYMVDCRKRKLAESTITSYANLLNPLSEFCKARGRSELSEVDIDLIEDFTQSRKVQVSTQRKELQCLRAFFWYCFRHKWVEENPSKGIKPPKGDTLPTLPFEPNEVKLLLDACDRIQNNYLESAARARPRAKALVLLLLYSGFRISDAVQLERVRVSDDGRLMVRVMKTGLRLYTRLGPECVAALKALPEESRYFFWSGTSELDTAVKSARRTIACLGRLTKIDAHPHRFRDTFSVALLEAGEDIRTVQLLLGHKSVKTTEKHYAHFVKSTQQRIEAATAKLNFT